MVIITVGVHGVKPTLAPARSSTPAGAIALAFAIAFLPLAPNRGAKDPLGLGSCRLLPSLGLPGSLEPCITGRTPAVSYAD